MAIHLNVSAPALLLFVSWSLQKVLWLWLSCFACICLAWVSICVAVPDFLALRLRRLVYPCFAQAIVLLRLKKRKKIIPAGTKFVFHRLCLFLISACVASPSESKLGNLLLGCSCYFLSPSLPPTPIITPSLHPSLPGILSGTVVHISLSRFGFIFFLPPHISRSL